MWERRVVLYGATGRCETLRGAAWCLPARSMESRAGVAEARFRAVPTDSSHDPRAANYAAESPPSGAATFFALMRVCRLLECLMEVVRERKS